MTHAPTTDRFKTAQAGGVFEAALAEIRGGAKRGHWIWFIFPQIAGLGSSPLAREFGIRDASEATRYVQDPLLGERLYTIAAAVVEVLRSGTPLVRLMGGEVDVIKLVSSMTLCEAIAGRLAALEPGAQYEALARAAREILEFAAAEGYPSCRATRRWLIR